MPAFQPYWGKPAVRNDRGDRGNVGIIRSPVRASILPDQVGPAGLPLECRLSGSQCDPIFFHHMAILSIIPPFFGQDCTERWRPVDPTDSRPSPSDDIWTEKGDANELHTHSKSNRTPQCPNRARR